MEAQAAVKLLDGLSSRRGYVRERALDSVVEYLNVGYCVQFAEKNFATILFGCLSCIKRGFSEEIALALRALGLLSMTIGPGDQADELYKESLPLIHQALSSRDEPSVISAINCLAVCTFVSEDVLEKEAAMKRIWDIILPSEGVHVLFAAICAWSFIFSGINLHQDYWRSRHKLSHLGSLLVNDDKYVRTAAQDAIDVLLEKELHGGGKVRQVLIIGDYPVEFRSLSKLVQVEYVLEFLGLGFVPHMLENEFLHDVFNFTPEEQTSKEDDRVYYCEREEIVVRVCMPTCKYGMKNYNWDAVLATGSNFEEPMELIHAPSRMAAISKGRTHLMKKMRMLKL